MRVHKKLVPREVVEKEHLVDKKIIIDDQQDKDGDLLDALEGVISPSLPWVISNGPI